MKKLIKNGTIVTAADEYKADVLIENGKVSAIGHDLTKHADEVMDAAGLYLFPGELIRILI